jgi:two-component system, LytTR family, response regulator
MMSIRCLVIDDKPLAIDILADYIRKTPFLTLAATTTNPMEALLIIRDQPIELIFLDIQMPELTGLQLMKIAGKKCKIIITSAYAKFALDGFEHDVVDYLLKPIPFERFYRAAEKALQLLDKNKSQIGINPTETAIEYLFIKTEHRIKKIDLKDILFIEGLQNYVCIQTASERILSLQPLKKIEMQLPPKDFARVHKSYIVALRHITSIERSRIFMKETVIPVGDNYRERFYKIIDKQDN